MSKVVGDHSLLDVSGLSMSELLNISEPLEETALAAAVGRLSSSEEGSNNSFSASI